VWLLTGQTTATSIRVYAHVTEIETVGLDATNADFDTLPNNMYALYIATNCCGTKGSNDGEGGCRTCVPVSASCDAKRCKSKGGSCSHCQCYCDGNWVDESKDGSEAATRPGCKQEPGICDCTHDELRCRYSNPVPYVKGCFDDAPRAVALNSDIQDLVVKQVTNATNGCCFTGWETIQLVPQDIEAGIPGDFVGMYEWDSSKTLKRLKNRVFNTNPNNVTSEAQNVLNISENNLKFGGYKNSTLFSKSNLCVVYRRNPEDTEALLVRLSVYYPVTSGSPFRQVCGYGACVALQDLFVDGGY
jgi:hypothetical protein